MTSGGLKDLGDELMPTMSAFLSPVEPARQDSNPASHIPLPWLEWQAKGRTRDLRVRYHTEKPLSKHAAPCLRAVFCRVQNIITCLLNHSHDTSPSSVAAMSGRHCSLIHTIPAPHQWLPCLEDTALLFTRYQPLISGCRVWKTLLSHSHDTSPSSVAAVCRGLRSLTHSR